MMGAVDSQAASIEHVQEGIMNDGGIMELVPVLILVKRGFFHVLNDGSAEKDVDNLHTLADTKYRLTAAYSLLHGFKLDDIQFCVYVSGAVIILPKKSRRNVTAARQKHAGAGVNPARGKGGKTGNSQTGEGGLIVDGVFRAPDDGNRTAVIFL